MVEEHPFLLYKSAKNNLGLSPIDIRVFPIISFSPHANPILGANGGMNMSSAKLRLGIYYLRKSVLLIFLNNHLTDYYKMTYCLKRKKQKTIFFFSKYA
jgi:hypothetical protein